MRRSSCHDRASTKNNGDTTPPEAVNLKGISVDLERIRASPMPRPCKRQTDLTLTNGKLSELMTETVAGGQQRTAASESNS